MSTTRQEAEGISLERQEARLRSYGCENLLFDVESGKTAKRKNYQKLCDMIESGTVAQVVAIRLDRLGRSIVELSRFYKLCVDNNCNIKIIELGLDLHSPFGKVIYTFLSALAELESDNIASRVRDSWKFKRENAIAHRTCFGYQRVDDVLKPHPVQAPIVRKLFDLILEPRSTEYALRYANTHYKEFKWSKSGLFKLLRNPTLRGHLQYTDPVTGDKILIENTHDGIITDREYLLFEKITASNAFSKTNHLERPINVLAGKVLCGDCGFRIPIHQTVHKKQSGTYLYRVFVCRNRTSGRCNNRKSISYDKIVKDVELMLRDRIIEESDQLLEAKMEPKNNKRKIQLTSQLEALQAIPDPIPYIVESIEKIKDELRVLDIDSNLELRNQMDKEEIIQALVHPNYFKGMTDFDKSMVFKELISSIVINDGKIVSLEISL